MVRRDAGWNHETGDNKTRKEARPSPGRSRTWQGSPVTARRGSSWASRPAWPSAWAAIPCSSVALSSYWRWRAVQASSCTWPAGCCSRPGVARKASLSGPSGNDGAWLAQPAVGIAVLAVLIVLRSLGLWWGGSLVWPLALAAAGLTLIWLQADDEDRDVLSGLAARLWPEVPGRRRISRLRVAMGAILVGAGVASFLAANHALRGLRDGLLPLLGVLVGLALIFLPWWRRLARELTDERRERVRSQERAEMAAHLHDSVLQTLALIQRRADDPRAVVSLARSQERELRAWLNERRGGPSAVGTTFAGALRQTAADVEIHHEMPVEVVTVGDCELDERLRRVGGGGQGGDGQRGQVVGRQRRLASTARSSAAAVTVFVRDRGRGFDPATDRRTADGASPSPSTAGWPATAGSAKIRSWPGQGTEVELSIVRRLGVRDHGRGCSWSTTTTSSGRGSRPSWAMRSRWSGTPPRWKRPST